MDKVKISRRRPINRKTKLNIVFDEKARKEFLTGFRKRKLQRQRKAQEELKQKLKDERKRIKLQAQKSFERLKLSYQPIPEVEELLRNSATEYDYGSHSVSVVELNSDFLQKKNNYIGENKVQYEENKSSGDEMDNDNDSEEEVTGMELKTRKEIRKEIKKKATDEVKKSKAYQLKNKLEQQKQKKKALQQKKRRIKLQMKSKKGKKRKNKHK